MLTRGGMTEIVFYRRLHNLGISDEYFYSLPYECQQAILMAGNSNKYDNKKKRENFQKRMALRQYEFEENFKEKVKILLKRKK